MKKIFSLLTLFAIGLFAFAITNDAATVGSTLSDVGAPTMAMAAVVKNELAEKELIKHFRHEGTWLAKITSKNQWVGNDTIKLNDIGADPEVLIDNTTYPIAVKTREDGSTSISLYKYDTENTKVTDDEAYALPYDKIGSVQQQHRETLEEHTQAHALHSIAPASNSEKAPIIETTGPNDGDGRKRLVYKDLVNLAKKMNNLKISKMGRCLVLSPDHLADLLIEDKALNVQYQNHKEGAIAKNYGGFEIYEDIFAPQYTAALEKIPFGSDTVGRPASIVFHRKTVAKARGTVKRYFSDAATNPTMRETVVGFRLYFVCIPTRVEGQAAIVSGTV